MNSSAILAELRRTLDELRAIPRIDDVAKRLRISVRTLQRRLGLEATSFGREVRAACVRRAQRLMLDSSLPLSSIAMDAGFSSPARLSAAFRKIEGTSPTAWRSTYGSFATRTVRPRAKRH